MNRFWLVLAIVIATGGYNTYQQGAIYVEITKISTVVQDLKTVQDLQLQGKLKAEVKTEDTSFIKWGMLAAKAPQ